MVYGIIFQVDDATTRSYFKNKRVPDVMIISMNSSNERKQDILDFNGNKIGEVHYGHKYYVNGKKVVGQDHFHLISEGNVKHHLLPDKLK